MNSSVDPFVPGQATTFYPPGTVMQHMGQWYIHRNGKWELMTDKEVEAMK